MPLCPDCEAEAEAHRRGPGPVARAVGRVLAPVRAWWDGFWPEPRPHNGECPVTGDTFYYEKHRFCPYCDWRLWSYDGTPMASHRRSKPECSRCGEPFAAP